MTQTTVRRVALALTLAASVLAGACEQISKMTSPSATDTSGVPAGTVALIGQWGSPSSSAVANLSSCADFQWSIASQTSTAISGQFSAVCLGAYRLSGSVTGTLTSGVVHIVLNGSATLPTVGACAVTVTADGSMDGSDTIRLPYTAQTCLGTFTGTETLKKKSSTPAPIPDPTPAPPPPPPPPPPPAPPADEIDLGQATVVLGPNVAAWPQTATVLSASAANDQLCINHTKTGQWPTTLFFDTDALIEGNEWVFANIGGHWYGGAGEWQRPGQVCKAVTADTIARDAFAAPSMEPLRSWVPKPGEVFAVMSSTPARAWPSMRTSDERSNVVLVRWGQ